MKAVINSNKYIENSMHTFCWFYNSTKEFLAVYVLFLTDIEEKEKPILLHKYNKIIQDVALHKA